jgi:hypothetical protein
VSTLFERQAVLIVGSLRVTDLRMQFKIKADTGIHPNTCEIVVTNLSKDTRSQIKQKGLPIILQAGYPSTIATIFSGKTRTVDHVRENADWNSIIRAGDGETEFGFATISTSYRPGVPIATVLNDLLDHWVDPSTGLPLDTMVARQTLAQVTGQYQKGFVVHGKVSSHFDDILKSLGFEWSIQDGRVQVLPKGGTTNDEAVFLSPDTGLIGSPQHGSGDGKQPQKNAGAVKFKSLLQPKIKPGKKLAIQSEGVNGVLRVISREHRGDTKGGDWVSEGEAMPLPNEVIQAVAI